MKTSTTAYRIMMPLRMAPKGSCAVLLPKDAHRPGRVKGNKIKKIVGKLLIK